MCTTHLGSELSQKMKATQQAEASQYFWLSPNQGEQGGKHLQSTGNQVLHYGNLEELKGNQKDCEGYQVEYFSKESDISYIKEK